MIFPVVRRKSLHQIVKKTQNAEKRKKTQNAAIDESLWDTLLYEKTNKQFCFFFRPE